MAAGMALGAFAMLPAIAFAWCAAIAKDAAPVQHAQSSNRIGLDAPAALSPAAGPVPECGAPQIEVVPVPAGLAEFILDSACRKFETVRIRYAGMEFIRPIDGQGRLEFALDCVAGDVPPVEFVLADGSEVTKKIATIDLDRVTKIAVIWSAPVNLDLHAFEYAAAPEAPDHIWESAPSSLADAKSRMDRDKRGHGFLSTKSSGKEKGTKLEVYTFWHEPNQKSGVINMALDYESRARVERDVETCGTGLYSDLEYEAVVFDRKRSQKRSLARFASLDCAIKLTGNDRYNHKAVPEIVVRN